MPAVGQTLRVEGLRELQRAFRVADTRLHRELRDRLKVAAEPVRADAERLAVQGIRRIGLPWSEMRVGVTARSVYIAPKQRGSRRGTGRPNLAGLLLGRAMVPALQLNEPGVAAEAERLLAEVGRAWETA